MAVEVAAQLLRDVGRQPVMQDEALPIHRGVERLVGGETAGHLRAEHAGRDEVRARQLEGLVRVGEVEPGGVEVDVLRRAKSFFLEQFS